MKLVFGTLTAGFVAASAFGYWQFGSRAVAVDGETFLNMYLSNEHQFELRAERASSSCLQGWSSSEKIAAVLNRTAGPVVAKVLHVKRQNLRDEYSRSETRKWLTSLVSSQTKSFDDQEFLSLMKHINNLITDRKAVDCVISNTIRS